MQQVEKLWNYQKADIKVVRYENEMRQFPMRTKLLKLRNLVADQQTLVRGMENDADTSLKKLEEMQQNHEKLLQQIEEISSKLGDEDAFVSSSQVRKTLNLLQECENKLKGYEKDLSRMVRDSQHIGVRYRDIRQKAVKARDEYTKLKAVYDKELEKQNAKLAQLKEERSKEAEGIDKALLERYETIRGQSFPPMATLNGDQCGGCYMSLPAVVMQNIRNDDTVTECENCGRILIALPENN